MNDYFLTISTLEGELFDVNLSEVGGAGSKSFFHIMHWRKGKSGLSWYYSGSLRRTDRGWSMDGRFEPWLAVFVAAFETT